MIETGLLWNGANVPWGRTLEVNYTLVLLRLQHVARWGENMIGWTGAGILTGVLIVYFFDLVRLCNRLR